MWGGPLAEFRGGHRDGTLVVVGHHGEPFLVERRAGQAVQVRKFGSAAHPGAATVLVQAGHVGHGGRGGLTETPQEHGHVVHFGLLPTFDRGGQLYHGRGGGAAVDHRRHRYGLCVVGVHLLQEGDIGCVGHHPGLSRRRGGRGGGGAGSCAGRGAGAAAAAAGHGQGDSHGGRGDGGQRIGDTHGGTPRFVWCVRTARVARAAAGWLRAGAGATCHTRRTESSARVGVVHGGARTSEVRAARSRCLVGGVTLVPRASSIRITARTAVASTARHSCIVACWPWPPPWLLTVPRFTAATAGWASGMTIASADVAVGAGTFTAASECIPITPTRM